MYLKGIVVIDFSHYIPGPFASLRLADFGAEVIKVEPPSGDLARSTLGPKDESRVVLEANNSGKKSISIDLKKREGVEIVKSLIKKADVLIESFRPGVMKRLGLGYEEVREVNEKIIYCSISGYGQKGDQVKLGSHDINYMALSGVLSQFKDSSGKPVHPTITLADSLGGMAASESIAAALFHRERTGKGAYLDISLVDSLAALMNNHFVAEEQTGKINGLTVLSGQIICYAIYETKDDRFVALAALERKFWENFCEALGRPEWLDAHHSFTSNDNPVYQELKQLFKSKTLKEWEKFGTEVDCCLTPIFNTDEAKQHFSKEDRQFVTNQYGHLYVATRYDSDILPRRTPAPKKGEHTVEILKKMLLLSDEEIKFYQSKGVIY
jgi:alpha-methylacyl-CoA racemase